MLAQITGINSPSTFFNNSDTLAGQLVSRILLFALIIGAFYFFARLVLGGYNLLTSAGDPGKIQTAQSVIVSALVGLVIVVSAFFISQAVTAILGIDIPGL